MGTNQIGIDEAKSKQLASGLNLLLSDFQLFYINARGFHWNIKGDKFFELHAKFEELYTDALTKVDEVAERILTLGHKPVHSFSGYLQSAAIKEITDISDGTKAVEAVIDGFKSLLTRERELLKISAEANDEGTNALMSDYIREQEKSVWMYSAYLK
jgi:starvation-inducible DNA-binding protein